LEVGFISRAASGVVGVLAFPDKPLKCEGCSPNRRAQKTNADVQTACHQRDCGQNILQNTKGRSSLPLVTLKFCPVPDTQPQ
jgi:hypothetical protein